MMHFSRTKKTLFSHNGSSFFVLKDILILEHLAMDVISVPLTKHLFSSVCTSLFQEIQFGILSLITKLEIVILIRCLYIPFGEPSEKRKIY